MKEPATICFVLLACNFMQYILNSLLILSRWKSLPLRDLHLRQRQNSNREGRRKEMWKWGVTYRETLSSHLLVRWWHKWQIDIKRTQREWNFGREGLLLVPSQEATSHCRQVWGRWARYLADPGPPKTKDFVWQAVRITLPRQADIFRNTSHHQPHKFLSGLYRFKTCNVCSSFVTMHGKHGWLVRWDVHQKGLGPSILKG